MFGSNISANGEEGASQISSLHKSKKNTGKMVRINFFRTVNINQRLAAIWGAFYSRI